LGLDLLHLLLLQVEVVLLVASLSLLLLSCSDLELLLLILDRQVLLVKFLGQALQFSLSVLVHGERILELLFLRERAFPD
jgi:hypothetical protein